MSRLTRPPRTAHTAHAAATRRGTAAVVATLLVGGLAGGCSLFEQDPTPEDAAKALAAGLARADLTGVTLKGATAANATAFVQKAYKGMGDLRPTVSMATLTRTEDSPRATATLHTTWDVSASPKDWTYDTQVSMTLVDGRWQVAWTPRLVAPELRSDETLSLSRVWPRRADIVDQSGTKLMTEREVAVVGIDKSKVSGSAATSSARRLAALVGIDAGRYADKVAAAGSKAFVEAITFRHDDPTLEKNGARIDAVKGSLVVPALQVLGPSRTWATPVLGSVGDVTAEDVKTSKGLLEAGDTIGKSGLEARYDERLRGTPGLAVLAVRRGADGSALDKRELYAEQSTDGEPLVVTLDQKAQTAAEKALAGQKDHPTALVAVRVSTGEVLAAAVGPGADGANVSLAGKAAPGSTFKIVSSLALVRKGATADSPLPCTDAITVNGRTFSNYSDYPKNHLGDIPLKTALAYSCNTAFISQYKAVSQDDLISAAESLGMGVKLDLPFAGFLGSVPKTDNVVEHAASFIGQGRVEASPLTMALVVASVMKGQTVRPRLVVGDEKLPAPATPLDPAQADVLRQEMREVVQEGSGKVLQQVGVEYAKTGTAEFGTKNPPDTHAWMVAGRGDIAIAAYNEVGDNGVTGAAPFIIDFLTSTNLH